MASLNIVFFGIDAFSNIVLNSLISSSHQVSLVVVHPYEEKLFNVLKSTCEKNNIPILLSNKINSEEVMSSVREANPDLCVIAHFERIIKKDLLSIPRLGFINLHPSLLPYYRGLAPQHMPIINGEEKVGITVHYVDEGTDTGDIILQKEYSIDDDIYVADLHALWMNEYKTIVLEAIDKMLNGDPVTEQRYMQGSFYAKMEDKPYTLDKSWSKEAAYRWVRAMSFPYHGVSYDDKIIYKARVMEYGEVLDDEEIELKFCDGSLVAEWFE